MFRRRHNATVFKAGLAGSNLRNFGNDVTTRCILRALNASKCVCGRGSAPPRGPRWGAHSAPPSPLAGFGGGVGGGEEGKGKEKERERGKGRGGEGRKGRKVKVTPPPSINSGYGRV